MAFESTAALRHEPKQARGQRKVEHILRCAEALFAEVGFEAATTNAIAARAGVSIGSLYQFFSSKDAVLSAMADRYLVHTKAVLSKAVDVPEGTNFDQLVMMLLETVVKLQEQRPYFLQCLGHQRLSSGVVKAVQDVYDELALYVMALFARGTIEKDSKILRLRAQICVETMA